MFKQIFIFLKTFFKKIYLFLDKNIHDSFELFKGFMAGSQIYCKKYLSSRQLSHLLSLITIYCFILTINLFMSFVLLKNFFIFIYCNTTEFTHIYFFSSAILIWMFMPQINFIDCVYIKYGLFLLKFIQHVINFLKKLFFVLLFFYFIFCLFFIPNYFFQLK